MKFKQVRMSEETNKQITALSEKRRASNNPVWTKQGIIQEQIEKLFKKEVGNWSKPNDE